MNGETLPSARIDNLSANANRIGDILLDRGILNKSELSAALAMQSSRDAMLGEIIISHKLAKQSDVSDALDIQFDGVTLDISVAPPDPMLLVDVDPAFCLKLDFIPWRKMDGQVIIAALDPHNPQILKFATNRWPNRATVVRARPDAISQAIESAFSQELTHRAKLLCPDKYSCRGFGNSRSWLLTLLGVIGFGFVAYQYPTQVFLACFFLAMTANIATTMLRLAAFITFLFRSPKNNSAAAATIQLADFRKRPKVSVLLPLYHESRVLDSLLNSLEKLTYPKELLDIIILLEEADDITAAAIAARNLPFWIRVITVPKDVIQTKPRAMNFALPFCKGEIIGIYDAEDRPDPDQIDKIVAHLTAAPQEVASVQCFLDFYNSKSNWMARCFTIEYAVWFRVIMQALQHMKIPLPLGGTSVFVRRSALEQVGAWDAHNVTEDADLGMRLARFGYRCEMVNSTTWEEANNRPVAWVKQRSRWLKGFAMTWVTQMRNPVQLYRELGFFGFAGLQIILFGTVTTFLLAPIFWVIWTSFLGVDWAFMAILPDWFWSTTFLILIGGELVMINIATLAMLIKKRPGLIPFIITLPFYWPLGTFAAYKALFELFFAPFYWDKTDHGLD